MTGSGVSANVVTVAGVVLAAAAGAVLAFVRTGVVTALLVAALLAGRLACTNMDGTLARQAAPRPFVTVVNELGDRGADLVALAGVAPHLGWGTGAVLFATTLPSWSALAVSAAGGPRSNCGPMGKAERCALLVVAAGTGWFAPIGVIVAIGAALTAIVRLVAGAHALRGPKEA